jgi:hypothetical protein
LRFSGVTNDKFAAKFPEAGNLNPGLFHNFSIRHYVQRLAINRFPQHFSAAWIGRRSVIPRPALDAGNKDRNRRYRAAPSRRGWAKKGPW